MDAVYAREVPPEWEAELRRISPRDTGLSWLEFRWEFVVGHFKTGWRDCSRWVLYEMQPAWAIQPWRRSMLEGAPPRLLPAAIRQGRLAFVTDWQHELYRTRRLYPWAFWVLQGDQGGVPAMYSRREEKTCEALGLPTRPPPVGALPYAGFDWRTVEQILMRDQLLKAGMRLDQIVEADRITRQCGAEIVDADMAYRAQFLNWFQGTLAPSADFLTWFSKRAEVDRVLARATRAQRTAAERFTDEYIETGEVPVEERSA